MRYRTQLPNEDKYVILVIRDLSDSHISGSIYHSLGEERVRFQGFMEFAEEMEKLSDFLTYPSVSMERRSLLTADEPSDLEERVDRIEGRMRGSKPLGTYRLQLLHRFNGTWQGTLQDRNSGEMWRFESFLDLVRNLEKQFSIPVERSFVPELSDGNYFYQKDGQEFSINILFQRNRTWQGTLRWLTGKKTVNFRSYLELLLILREVFKLEQAPIIQMKDYDVLVKTS